MNNESLLGQLESERKIVVVSPASESLLHINEQDTTWPEEIKNNNKLQKEIALRSKAYENLEKIFNITPNANSEITENNEIDEDIILQNYQNLTDFLNQDEYNLRIILYVPFEMIPDINWQPKSNKLKETAEKFMDKYMDCWYKLLSVNDVRANFVDGDVLETELRNKPLERVTKVAHFIPQLLKKGYITISFIKELIENNSGTTLQESVLDTLPILVDMDLINQDEMDKILNENNVKIPEREKEEIPPEMVTDARKKWLQSKVENVEVTKYSVNQLDIPFSERENAINKDVEIIKKQTESIELNHELSKFLYPVTILFGSKIKGYGADDADIDLAVFIKPGTAFDEREKIHKLLSQTFSRNEMNVKVVEFWLEEKDNNLNVIDFPKQESYLGKSSWTHVLFGGAWIGNESDIRELHEKLLSEYFYSKDKKINETDARKIWLEEIERDTLQYRLMHKGYARFFPKQGGINTEHSNQIDGESMFYDSGYRRLATKLFLKKVFLPQLEK